MLNLHVNYFLISRKPEQNVSMTALKKLARRENHEGKDKDRVRAILRSREGDVKQLPFKFQEEPLEE